MSATAAWCLAHTVTTWMVALFREVEPVNFTAIRPTTTSWCALKKTSPKYSPAVLSRYAYVSFCNCSSCRSWGRRLCRLSVGCRFCARGLAPRACSKMGDRAMLCWGFYYPPRVCRFHIHLSSKLFCQNNCRSPPCRFEFYSSYLPKTKRGRMGR